jgi:hypothetical protein
MPSNHRITFLILTLVIALLLIARCRKSQSDEGVLRNDSSLDRARPHEIKAKQECLSDE